MQKQQRTAAEKSLVAPPPLTPVRVLLPRLNVDDIIQGRPATNQPATDEPLSANPTPEKPAATVASTLKRRREDDGEQIDDEPVAKKQTIVEPQSAPAIPASPEIDDEPNAHSTPEAPSTRPHFVLPKAKKARQPQVPPPETPALEDILEDWNKKLAQDEQAERLKAHREAQKKLPPSHRHDRVSPVRLRSRRRNYLVCSISCMKS